MKIKECSLLAIYAALCAVSAWITVPFAIPFTLQTFAVFLTCFVLGGGKAALCLAVYLLVGAIGLPVFSGFRGGVGVLIGPTGGYLIGFVTLCLVYWLVTSLLPKKRAGKILGSVAGLAVLYLFGTVWFVLQSMTAGKVGFAAAFMQCVLPFVLPDLVKLSLAFTIAERIGIVTQRLYGSTFSK